MNVTNTDCAIGRAERNLGLDLRNVREVAEQIMFTIFGLTKPIHIKIKQEIKK
jgi:hypothetical protein